MDRRSFLALGLMAVAGTGGYATISQTRSSNPPEPVDAPEEIEEDQHRGEADVDIHEHANFDDGPDIEYLDGSVKVVTVRHQGEPQQHRVLEFETWAKRAGSDVLMTPLLEYVQPQLDLEIPYELTVGRGATVGDWDDWYLYIAVHRELDIPLEDVVAVVPQTATATVELATREHTQRYPVYAQERKLTLGYS